MDGMLLIDTAPKHWATYEDVVHEVVGCDDIFGDLQVLSLNETILHEVFLYAVGGPPPKLQSVDHISIQDSLSDGMLRNNLFPAGEAAFAPFIAWLSARAQTPSRISEVKFVYTKDVDYCEPWSEHVVENLRKRLQNEILTGAAVKEGECRNNRVSTPIRWR